MPAVQTHKSESQQIGPSVSQLLILQADSPRNLIVEKVNAGSLGKAEAFNELSSILKDSSKWRSHKEALRVLGNLGQDSELIDQVSVRIVDYLKSDLERMMCAEAVTTLYGLAGGAHKLLMLSQDPALIKSRRSDFIAAIKGIVPADYNLLTSLALNCSKGFWGDGNGIFEVLAKGGELAFNALIEGLGAEDPLVARTLGYLASLRPEQCVPLLAQRAKLDISLATKSAAIAALAVINRSEHAANMILDLIDSGSTSLDNVKMRLKEDVPTLTQSSRPRVFEGSWRKLMGRVFARDRDETESQISKSGTGFIKGNKGESSEAEFLIHSLKAAELISMRERNLPLDPFPGSKQSEEVRACLIERGISVGGKAFQSLVGDINVASAHRVEQVISDFWSNLVLMPEGSSCIPELLNLFKTDNLAMKLLVAKTIDNCCWRLKSVIEQAKDVLKSPSARTKSDELPESIATARLASIQEIILDLVFDPLSGSGLRMAQLKLCHHVPAQNDKVAELAFATLSDINTSDKKDAWLFLEALKVIGESAPHSQRYISLLDNLLKPNSNYEVSTVSAALAAACMLKDKDSRMHFLDRILNLSSNDRSEEIKHRATQALKMLDPTLSFVRI